MEDAINAPSQNVVILSVLTAVITSVVISLLYWIKSAGGSSSPQTPTPNSDNTKKIKPSENTNISGDATKPLPKKVVKKGGGTGTSAISNHPLYINTLRGHTDSIVDLDLDLSGKLLASLSNDRTARIWFVKDMEKNKDIKYTRIPLEEQAVSLSLSPDNKAVAILHPDIHSVYIYKLGKKPGDATSHIFSIEDIKGDLKDVAISPTGKFLVVSTTTTTVYVYTLKGERLHVIDTAQVNNAQVSVSPCKDYVAVSGFTPTVSMWAVKHSSKGQYQQVVDAMSLSGHSSGVYSFSFSGDSRRVCTVSRDGTWRLFNIDVSWELREDPKLISHGTYEGDKETPAVIALSPDGRVVAIATHTTVNFYNADTAEHMDVLESVHSDAIIKIKFCDTGRYLYTSGSDKTVRVWLNRPGLVRNIELWKESLLTATNTSHKARLKQQIQETEDFVRETKKGS